MLGPLVVLQSIGVMVVVCLLLVPHYTQTAIAISIR